MPSTPTTIVHCLREPFDVYIGRKSPKFPQSIWHNPYHIGEDGSREDVIRKHWEYLQTQPELLARVEELRGKRLGCYCRLSTQHAPQCHGDNYLRLLGEYQAPPEAPQLDLF